ncbi:hypothetical protein Tco_0085986 [Tanacetum coccineum]
MEAQNSNDVRNVEIRSRPKMLTETIASMTRDQKQVVKSMGFGGVLGLQLKSLSKDFVLFVIDQLDPVQMVIHTHNGDIPIDRLAISERITKNTKCDRMFQLDFLILMSSLLISASKNNSCNREILATLPVDFVCQEYDWCEYVLRTVETCKEDLKKNLFCGPLVFLLLLYCDRVSIALDPPVLRNRPVVAQWKNEDLQRRFQAESSGERFGLGLFLDEWKNTVEARDWRKQNVHFEECGCLSIEDDGHEMEDEKGPSLQNAPSLENSHVAAATKLENSSLVEQFSELSVSLVGDAAGLSLSSPNAAGLSLSSPNVFEYANDGLSLSSPNAAGLSLSSPNAAGADAYADEVCEFANDGADSAVAVKARTVVADAYVCETQEDPVLCADEAKPLKRSKRQSKQVAGPLRRSERKKIPTKRYTPTSEGKTQSKLLKSSSDI